MTALMEQVVAVPTRRVVAEIARFEARRLWRHPALIGAVAVTAYELYQRSDLSGAPVLNRLSYQLAWPMLLLAGGIYLALGNAASRRHGEHNLEGLDALPTVAATNSVGVGLAFVSPLLVGVALQMGFLVPRLFDRPVTWMIWTEFLTGPATLALGAAAGLAMGWGLRWRGALPVFGVGVVAVITTLWWAESGTLFGPYTPWLGPVPGLDSTYGALEASHRPSDFHLGYVLALAGFFAALASIRGRRVSGKLALSGAAIAMLLLAAWAGTTQLRELTSVEEATRRAPYLPASGDYVCEERGTLTLCAYHGYEAWIDEWAAQIEPVLALVPPEVAGRPLEVRQQVTYFVDEDVLPQEGDIRTGLWLSRAPVDAALIPYPLNLSLAVAAWSVGLPTGTESPCFASGQGRAVAALWYAIQASPESAEGLRILVDPAPYRRPVSENFPVPLGYLQPAFGVRYLRSDAEAALAIARLPQPQVAETLAQRFSEVTDPATTGEEVAAWFGISWPRLTPWDDTEDQVCR